MGFVPSHIGDIYICLEYVLDSPKWVLGLKNCAQIEMAGRKNSPTPDRNLSTPQFKFNQALQKLRTPQLTSPTPFKIFRRKRIT